MPLYLFYTVVQKSRKWPKTQIKGGPAVKSVEKISVTMSSLETKVMSGDSSVEKTSEKLYLNEF